MSTVTERTHADFTDEQKDEWRALFYPGNDAYQSYVRATERAGEALVYAVEHPESATAREDAEEYASAAIKHKAEWHRLNDLAKVTAYGAFLSERAAARI